MRDLEVLERVLHIAGLNAVLGHYFGVDRGRRRIRPVGEHLRQMQDSADAVGELGVFAGEDAFEQRHGGIVFAAGPEEEAKLSGGKQIVRRDSAERAELLFGAGLAVHA